jgi:hypothetical protein
VTEPAAPVTEVALPPGTDEVLGVFVNGVERRPGEDYEVLSDRVRFAQPLTRAQPVTGIGKLLLSIGIGVYPKGDQVDLQLRRGARTDVIRARPLP